MKRALAVIIVASLLIVTTATVLAVAVSSATAPRLAMTQSGVIDRTHRTDRIKAPERVIRVASECRSA